jgi:DNA invertase Pin-like site-specific DNA recombinase
MLSDNSNQNSNVHIIPDLSKEGFMVYGYIRVSTDKQSVENQRYEINRFCERNVIVVGRWVEETMSGARSVGDRALGRMLKTMKKGDTIICSELSRLGRNLLMIMGILNDCMSREIQVWTIKDNYRLGNDINCKVLAFAFGLSAEIERNLISQRTKEALARKRSEGTRLGRPKGSKSSFRKLAGKEVEIKALLDKQVSKTAIARIFGVHRLTLLAYISERSLAGRAKTKTN